MPALRTLAETTEMLYSPAESLSLLVALSGFFRHKDMTAYSMLTLECRDYLLSCLRQAGLLGRAYINSHPRMLAGHLGDQAAGLRPAADFTRRQLLYFLLLSTHRTSTGANSSENTGTLICSFVHLAQTVSHTSQTPLSCWHEPAPR